MDSPDPAALNALFAAGEYKACKKGYAALLTACDLGGEPDGDHPLAREAAAAFTNVAACNVMLNKVRAGGLGAGTAGCGAGIAPAAHRFLLTWKLCRHTMGAAGWEWGWGEVHAAGRGERFVGRQTTTLQTCRRSHGLGCQAGWPLTAQACQCPPMSL